MGVAMTPEAAIYAFFSGFDIPAYPSAAVPAEGEEGHDMPYLTYDLVLGEWDGGQVNVPVNVWFRTTSEAGPNAFVRRMRDAIGLGGVYIPCDGGALWITRGSPWAQAVTVDGEEDGVKRRYVNVNIEYMIP